MNEASKRRQEVCIHSNLPVLRWDIRECLVERHVFSDSPTAPVLSDQQQTDQRLSSAEATIGESNQLGLYCSAQESAFLGVSRVIGTTWQMSFMTVRISEISLYDIRLFLRRTFTDSSKMIETRDESTFIHAIPVDIFVKRYREKVPLCQNHYTRRSVV